ncbi:hypothetical protein RP20_CCG027301 [Aedes albopictus]|nr:hypothetical protein RP20_CCG027301 [Aedes albopictus]
MSKTVKRPAAGIYPNCYIPSRLEDRRQRARMLRQERRRKPDKPDDFVTYEDSDSEEETPAQQHQVLSTSYNFVDYVRSRETDLREVRSVDPAYASRHILTHDMFKETPIALGNINKVFCSQWLSNRQLPTLDPLCVGENGHRDWVFDMCWLDDQFLVSGSRDTKVALWRINEDTMEFPVANSKEGEEQEAVPTYAHISPVAIKDCRGAQKIRAICFHKEYREIALLSLNGYMHLFNAETFSQKLSRKLPNCQENVCIACQPNGLYAVGCRSYTLLLDPRTLQAVKKIASRYSGCGIRSASFQGNILTIGTGLGMLMFYDIRAGKYLESQTSASRTVVLKASRGYVAQFPEEEMDNFQQIKYVPAIYTHCYDSSGTRLFTAGGPLPATLIGNYAGIWQ